MSEIDHIHETLSEISKKLDSVIVQTTRTNGKVSMHAMILYPLVGAFLLLAGALLSKGIIDITLFK